MDWTSSFRGVSQPIQRLIRSGGSVTHHGATHELPGLVTYIRCVFDIAVPQTDVRPVPRRL